jgi:hypothetical protein
MTRCVADKEVGSKESLGYVNILYQFDTSILLQLAVVLVFRVPVQLVCMLILKTRVSDPCCDVFVELSRETHSARVPHATCYLPTSLKCSLIANSTPKKLDPS